MTFAVDDPLTPIAHSHYSIAAGASLVYDTACNYPTNGGVMSETVNTEEPCTLEPRTAHPHPLQEVV